MVLEVAKLERPWAGADNIDPQVMVEPLTELLDCPQVLLGEPWLFDLCGPACVCPRDAMTRSLEHQRACLGHVVGQEPVSLGLSRAEWTLT